MSDLNALELLEAPELRTLSHGAARVYWAALALGEGMGGSFVRRQRDVAELANMSDTALRRYLAELTGAGLLEVTSPGPEAHNSLRRYRTVLPVSLRGPKV